ncbi:MAG: hypothetical protein JST00_02675 [Deltaproteobacteria bacterium]|nr:hypothetical protein [Deltaproteobacteria bacterium]
MRLGLRRSRWGFVAATLACASAFAACSSFEEDPVTPQPEAGVDAASERAPEDVLDAGTDTSSTDLDAGFGDDATTVLASGLTGLLALTVSDTQEVFVASTNGEIRKLPLIGGDGGTKVIRTEPNVTGIAAVGPRLMWATAGNKLGRCDFDGNFTIDRSDAPLIALTPADSNSIFTVKQGNEVRRYESTNLNTGEGYVTGPGIADVAVASTTLYWAESPSGTIWSGPTTAMVSATQLVTGEIGVNGIAADLFGVSWLTPTAVKGRATNQAPKVISNDKAVAIAARDGAVYWLANAPPGRLRKAELNDDVGPRQTLASGFPVDFKPSQKAIALTPTFVVWITSDGRVLRHPR